MSESKWVKFDPKLSELPPGVRIVWEIMTATGPVIVRPGQWLVFEPDGSVRVSATGPHFVLEVHNMVVSGGLRNG